MPTPLVITRSQFLRIAAGGAFGSFVLLQSACGGGDDDDGGDGNPADAPAGDAPPVGDGPQPVDAATSCLNNGTSITIGGNHGHELTVSMADVSAGQQRTYDIAAAAGHPHSVTLTAAHFQMLSQNQNVTVESSTTSQHSHTITVRCA
jgi:hypothetical protein